MNNKKSLGRGLGSLFSEYEDYEINEKKEVSAVKEVIVEKVVEVPAKSGDEAQQIDISLIDRNAGQPRKTFNEKSLGELASSIKNYGIIQPLVLAKRGDRYIIVAGERRFRAAKMINLKTVPAIVKNYTDREIQEIAIIENLQREDLNVVESAKAIKELMDKYGMTQETIADKIGKSRSAVANTLRLLTLSEQVLWLVKENKLSASHARTLVTVEDSRAQLELAKLACDNKISVRELEKAIKKYLSPDKKKSSIASQSLELKEFMKVMQDKFSTKVTILGNDKKGRIYIDYYSPDDLQRIYSIVTKN